MTVGDPGNLNAGGVPGGPPLRGDDLDKNCTADKGRGAIHRYWVDEGDM